MVGVAGSSWAEDPYKRHELRYFDGSLWTEHVSDGGVVGVDPVRQQVDTSERRNDGASSAVLTRLRKTRYLGSHPRVTGHAEGLDLVFTTSGITFAMGKSQMGDIPWSSILDLAADTQEGVERRVTGTRLALLGAFALVAKKETTFSYLIVKDAQGDWVFAVPGLTAIELRSGLAPLRSYVPAQAIETLPAVDAPRGSKMTAADRLRALSSLLDDGLVTQDEFNERRRIILEDL